MNCRPSVSDYFGINRVIQRTALFNAINRWMIFSVSVDLVREMTAL